MNVSGSDTGLVNAAYFYIDTLILVCRPHKFRAVPVGFGRAGILGEIKAVF